MNKWFHIDNELCPWCYQNGLRGHLTSKRIVKWCEGKCGYRVLLWKRELTMDERRAYYDSRR